MADHLYDVGLIPGDGTGPEVVAEARKVLDAAAERFGFRLRFQTFPMSGRHYLDSGELLTDAQLSEIGALPATLMGAIGTPEVRPGILERGVLLKMRFELDLYINLRPVKLLPGVPTVLAKAPEDGIDFVVVRENTEGLYCGAGGFHKKGTPEEVATQESINTRKGVERCVRYAFDLAKTRRRKHLTLCGKTNVLTYAFDLWERVFEEVGAEYGDVTRDYNHVDALCMFLLMSPQRYDVIVTDNMFGDIITDVAAMLQGGLGVAASGNLHPGKTAVFEPVGGSAPQFTGKGVINPLAAIASGQMLLRYLGETDAAAAIERAMIATLKNDMKGVAVGEMGIGTSDVGDRVRDYLLAEK
ncbi:MAG: 3-isopropylmalate dehydrogenase [Deltaproteobacteria bacterium]|nr:3-isopropylmalate dehydrogenase [Deltaproteobacteria bacterium]